MNGARGWCAVRAAAALVVGGLGGLRAQAHVDVRWHVPAAGIAFGEVFVVDVVRTWPAGAVPEPFDQASLAPLAVELEAAARATESDGNVQERRRYRARALSVGELQIAPVVLRLRSTVGSVGGDAGAVVAASCTPPPLRVRSLLAEPPGDYEWLDVQELPRWRRLPWVLSLLAMVLFGTVWWWRRPRRTGRVPAEAVAVPLHERTLARLAALALPAPTVDPGPFHTQLAAIVREHTGARFGRPVDARTSEELATTVPIGTAALAGCLCACDLVKFAASRPSPESCAATRDQAIAFVQATASRTGGA